MALTINHANDYLAWTNVIAVTWAGKVSGSQAVASAVECPVPAEEADASNGAYTEQDSKWFLPDTLMGGNAIKVGDTVTRDSDSQVFTVLAIELEGTVWTCVARDKKLHAHLDDTVTIQNKTVSTGEFGQDVETWADETTGLAARIQPVESIIDSSRLAEDVETQYDVFFAAEQTLDASNQLKDESNGNIFRIIRWTKMSSVSDLFTVRCERIT